MEQKLERRIKESAPDYRIAKNNYGTLIIAKSPKGFYTMLDEPTYMDWRDRRHIKYLSGTRRL